VPGEMRYDEMLTGCFCFHFFVAQTTDFVHKLLKPSRKQRKLKILILSICELMMGLRALTAESHVLRDSSQIQKCHYRPQNVKIIIMCFRRQICPSYLAPVDLAMHDFERK
jgi:hypothetical protein